MKRILAALIASALALGCDGSGAPVALEEPQGTVTLTSDSDFYFLNTGGEASVSFTASGDWYAYPDNSIGSKWCTVTPSKGSAGNATVTVKVLENGVLAEVKGSVIIACGTGRATVTLRQEANDGDPTFGITSEKSFEAAPAGSSFEVTTYGNVPLTAKVIEGGEWLSVPETKSFSSGSFTISASANDTYYFRSGSVVIGNDEFALSDTVRVSQKTVDGIDRTSISILAIGNSFSVDAMEYLYPLLKDVGFKDITLGNLYVGGCSLETHVSYITSSSAMYQYYVNTSGSWTSTTSVDANTAIGERQWDYVSMQQASGYSGVADSYEPYLTTLISTVRAKCPDAKLMWHMTWAYQNGSTHSAFPTYGSDQMTMYSSIVSAVRANILSRDDFAFVIPCGTAIQNLRTSYFGDTLTRDGYHMSYDIGRLTTAMMWARQISGTSTSLMTTYPTSYSYTDKAIAAIKDAVEKAYASPYEVTESAYPAPTAGVGNEALRAVFTAAGYSLSDYTELPFKYTLNGFYNSTSGFSTYTSENSSYTNCDEFCATQMFSKNDLPVGTVIVLKSGCQYRPEGWVNLSTKNASSARPGNVTAQIVVVDDAWWGSWTVRAFNIAQAGNPHLGAADMAELPNSIEFFVPKK